MEKEDIKMIEDVGVLVDLVLAVAIAGVALFVYIATKTKTTKDDEIAAKLDKGLKKVKSLRDATRK